MKRLLLLLSLIIGRQVNAQLCFNSVDTFAVGSQPWSVINADFNGDGKIDLATANSISNNVSVLLGTGAGDFGFAVNFSVGTNPKSIISADFNGDGKKDLATANNTSNDVSILLGTGTGSFGTAVSYTVGNNPNPFSLTSADFNGDLKVDLAVANANTNDVSILLGNGAGSFSAPTNFTVGTPGCNPVSITSADFNGDGIIDLAVANYIANNVSILLGTGTGSFGTAVNFVVGTRPYSIISFDFNGDSKKDLAVANNVSNDVSVLLGTGTGSFGLAVNFPTSNSNALSVTNADFNGDAITDLAVGNSGSGNVSVLLGTGTGSFGVSNTFTVLECPMSIITADFNGDFKADLAMTNSCSDTVSVLLNCTGLGIANFNNEQTLIVYPNPTNGKFIIESSVTEKQTIQVFDLNGKLLLTQNIINKTNIDASNLNNGIYNLTIKTEYNIINKKLIIAK